MCLNETVEMNRELHSSCHPKVEQDGLVLLVVLAVHNAVHHHSGLGASEKRPRVHLNETVEMNRELQTCHPKVNQDA